jgi:hypothetical protein
MIPTLMTWCPYDEALLDVKLGADGKPTQFSGECAHAALANLYLERGDELATVLPALAAHVDARRQAREKD